MQKQQQLHSSCKECSNGFPVPFLGCALVVVVLLLSMASPASSCTAQEKGSLLQFLAGLSRDSGLAASWKQNSTDCCMWEGVTCSADGAVSDVSLASKGLEGHISPSLGNLTRLLRLNLSHNLLSAGLPLELMSSSSIIVLDVSFNRLNGDMQVLPSSTHARPLQVLNISSNLFTGQFPSSTTWEVMNNLVALNASNNSFTGKIPSRFCRGSPSLAVVVLCYNQFTGSIPPGLGNCSMLKVLKAGHNNLSGNLPNELFDASSLEYLSLPDNVLHGMLDGAQISKLGNLTTIDLGGNNFSGKIPNSIGQLKRLAELHLDNNNMSGELPSSLSNCTNLITVDLKSNHFNGELTKINFSRLLNLRNLDLLYNNFTGTIPESIYSCTKLAALRVSGNNLHGQLSPGIASLKSLTFLSLGFNNFTNITNTLRILKNSRNLTSLLIGGSNFKGESMPEDEIVDGFDNLQVLSIAGCSLSGNIPLWLSKLKKLEMLFLQNNQLNGPIPGWIKSLNLLFHLDISNNSLTGVIPRALMEMPMLKSVKIAPRLDSRAFELPVYAAPSRQYRITSAFPKVLNLGNNNFTGVIPDEIGQLNSLVILNFSSNSLSGKIPQQLCNLTNLRVLDLSSNDLTGIIPSALKNLHFLSAFNISHNDLEGPIPDGVQLSTFPSSSFEGNPKLCVMLASKGLEGQISKSLGKLTGLQYLNLSHNSLYGGLPLELVSSSNIITLDVSFNQLNGTLHELPSSTPAWPLKVLNISSNLFAGQFPSTTWKAMENLKALNASNNSFSGPMPTDFCNTSSSLTVLDLCLNKLSGNISPGIGDCSRLRELRAGYNYLNGTLPDDLFNATLLEYLSFPNNDLHGGLDSTRMTNLRNLIALDLGGNKFSGKIPDSIGKLKKLEELHLNNNNMSGELPSGLSNCTDLIIIDLKSNNFSGELRKVNFSNLPRLKTLDLYLNHFNGTVPESIYSCSNLTALRVSSNKLYGQLSPRISNLKYLNFLSLASNFFINITNALHILKSSRNLNTLLIGDNFKGELMPEDDIIDGFENLQFLDIEDCQLLGKIPLWISRLTNLEMLLLNSNQLTGPIPGWINSLSHLFFMDVSNNNLTGKIPLNLTEMPMLKSMENATHWDPRVFELPVYNGPSLQYRVVTSFPTVLNLSHNYFTGAIPPQIGQLKMLVVLDFSFNKLSGQIPESTCNLANLQVLDLSSNNLTGNIPAALNSLNFLSAFNISNNDLEGHMPSGGQFNTFQNSSFNGNPKLCGSMLTQKCGSASTHLSYTKHQNKKAVFAIAFGVFFGGIAVLLLLVRLLVSIRMKGFTTKKGRESNGDVEETSFYSSSEQTVVVMRIPQSKGEENKLKLADILKATNNFDKANIIGCGGYGLVYKAELHDGSKLAIKKLNGEMCLMEREFCAEVDALSMAQHENLVPLWGYCIQGNSRLLMYSYMENGSLDDRLHNRDDDGSSFLDWPMRLKIAQGASLGLSYIHDDCKPHIVHRDIKSSNILLDKEFKAYVADFGLARLLLPNQTHVTTELVGTMGYIPPEYGQAWVATLRGDIYSFGVVLLELLTGRRPVPVMSTSKELVPWVLQMRSEGKQIEVLDPKLQGTGYEEQMLMVFETACRCVDHYQFRRPAIMEVVSCLASIDADLQK